MTTWRSATEPDAPAIRLGGWVRILLRGGVLGAVVFGSLAVLLLLRVLERPLFKTRRPWTPYITQFVCTSAFVILGIRREVRGSPMLRPGAAVANHTSWLDIFALNASDRIYFVSKSEVARWPGIGWLARATGTVFIARDPRQAAAQRQLFKERLGQGHRLLFFPEGTSSDGLQVLPFKSTLFAAFFEPDLREGLAVQPISVRYFAPKGADARIYGWWGDMGFGPHLLATLAAARQGRVVISYHTPLLIGDFPDRKALAHAAEQAVRAGHSCNTKLRSQ